MRILIVGLGSIGKKHMRVLKKIPDIEIAALRTNKGTLKEPEEGLREFYKLEDALKFMPDGVIISNPTSLHIQSALTFLEKGIKVLIEKPIGPSVSEAKKLKRYSQNLRVAYCLRFMPIYHKIRNIFKNDKPFKLGFKRSYYLPNWHPYADYRDEYVAQKKMGGGVIRTLSHEIDLAIYWFGSPSQVSGVIDKISFLDMDADDYAFFSLKTRYGGRVNFELDLFSPLNINKGEAYTREGKYEWDMSCLQFTPYDEKHAKIIFTQEQMGLENMYNHQILDFLEFVECGKSQNASLNDAIETLSIIESIEK